MQLNQEFLPYYYISGISHVVIVLFLLELSFSVLRHGALGAFAKLRKVTLTLVLSVRPPVRIEQLGSHWMDFHEI